jgi:ArsR family transcriptional regulator
LSVLKSAGVVTLQKRGLQVYYRLRCRCITRFFACVEEVLTTAADEQLAEVGTRER